MVAAIKRKKDVIQSVKTYGKKEPVEEVIPRQVFFMEKFYDYIIDKMQKTLRKIDLEITYILIYLKGLCEETYLKDIITHNKVKKIVVAKTGLNPTYDDGVMTVDFLFISTFELCIPYWMRILYN